MQANAEYMFNKFVDGITPLCNSLKKVPFSDREQYLHDKVSRDERYVYYGTETLRALSQGVTILTTLVVSKTIFNAFCNGAIAITAGVACAGGLWALSQKPEIIGVGVQKFNALFNSRIGDNAKILVEKKDQ
ncbi:MAG: hypothetical protein H0U49_07780 [Parachlamydiaceae bacterium]|nr:hypothetical protein [Parachlamydiaceae bacterium]